MSFGTFRVHGMKAQLWRDGSGLRAVEVWAGESAWRRKEVAANVAPFGSRVAQFRPIRELSDGRS
jgi:hypothetical protein